MASLLCRFAIFLSFLLPGFSSPEANFSASSQVSQALKGVRGLLEFLEKKNEGETLTKATSIFRSRVLYSTPKLTPRDTNNPSPQAGPPPADDKAPPSVEPPDIEEHPAPPLLPPQGSSFYPATPPPVSLPPLLYPPVYSPPSPSPPPPSLPPPSPPPPKRSPPPKKPPPPLTKAQKAYTALQAFKRSLTEDPYRVMKSWRGSNVCTYTGVVCMKGKDVAAMTKAKITNPDDMTVVGIDLNGYNLAGTVPAELDYLVDLGYLHLGSNRLRGQLPFYTSLALLGEIDVSQNQLSGPFPSFVLHLPRLKYLDIRFNNFVGNIPPLIFAMKLDLLALNDNKLTQAGMWEAVGNSKASMLVLANNPLGGQLGAGIQSMASTLEELVLRGTNLTGPIPDGLGLLNNTNALDLSNNRLSGGLPDTVANLTQLVVLDISSNQLYQNMSDVPIFNLPLLENFTFANNFFVGEVPDNATIDSWSGSGNCLDGIPRQKADAACDNFYKTVPPPPAPRRQRPRAPPKKPHKSPPPPKGPGKKNAAPPPPSKGAKAATHPPPAARPPPPAVKQPSKEQGKDKKGSPGTPGKGPPPPKGGGDDAKGKGSKAPPSKHRLLL